MKTFKKILFALFATTMVVSFASCSDDDDDGKSFLNRNNKDCVCYVSLDGGEWSDPVSVPVSVEDYEGDCKEVTFSDLGKDANGDSWEQFYEEWTELGEYVTLECHEE